MTTYAVIGAGWRSEFYIRLGQLMPEKFELVGAVVRNPERAGEFQADFGISIFESITALLQFARPDFVIVAVS